MSEKKEKKFPTLSYDTILTEENFPSMAKKIMEDTRITAKKLAEDLGVTYPYFFKLMKHKVPISPKFLDKAHIYFKTRGPLGPQNEREYRAIQGLFVDGLMMQVQGVCKKFDAIHYGYFHSGLHIVGFVSECDDKAVLVEKSLANLMRWSKWIE